MKNILLTILLIFSGLIIIGLLFYRSLFDFSLDPPPTRTVHNMVVEKMEAMGKIELVKYQFKDIVKHEQILEWFPDPKILLIVVGEAVGCIDLAQVDSSDIQILNDTIYIQIPEPELCYVKVDHQQSKVYETWFTYWNEAEMVDEAYKIAELEIQRAARQSQVLENTRIQGEQTLTPILEALTGKKVILQFPGPTLRKE